jgi:hypothetical protein
MKGVAKDTRRSFNRQLHGDGTRLLGKWVSTTMARTVALRRRPGNPGFDFFQSGAQQVDIVQNDNATSRSPT